MWKRLLMLLLALGLMGAANTSLCCRVSLPEGEGSFVCSPQVLRRAKLAALMAAEEILPGKAELPGLHTVYSLSLRPAKASTAELSDALLAQTRGVSLSQAVYVKGVRLGTVDSADELRRCLRDFISSQLPTWAVSGHITEAVEFKAQYTRSGTETAKDDMVLLITGMSPVMYSDGEGYTARA